MLNSTYNMTLKYFEIAFFGVKNVKVLSLIRNVVMDVITCVRKKISL